MNYSNMTIPQLLMMLNPGAANTTYLQPNQESMLRNQSISPYTPQGNVQMPNMQPLNIEGLLGSVFGPGVQGAIAGANIGARGLDTPNEREFFRKQYQDSLGDLTEDSAYQKALGKMLGEQAGADLANRGVPSQREIDTLMQMLQRGTR
jgi:hypothetical protein